MTSRSISRKGFKSREFSSLKIIVTLSSFRRQKPHVQPSHECACSVVNAQEVTRDLNPMESLHAPRILVRAILIREIPVYSSLCLSIVKLRASFVTVMFRSISMRL